MDEVSEKEIREFMQKYYPQYADNLELGKILYERFIKKKKRVTKPSVAEEVVKIADLKPGTRARIRGVVAEAIKHSYYGCAICKKKNCRNREHKDAGMKEWFVTTILVGDDTGTIYAAYIGDKHLAIDVGDEVEIYGYVKEYKGKAEMVIYDGKVVKKAEVKPEEVKEKEEDEEKKVEEEKKEEKPKNNSINWDEIDDDMVKRLLKVVEASGRIKKEILEEAARRKGIDLELAKKYLKVVKEKGVEYYVLK